MTSIDNNSGKNRSSKQKLTAPLFPDLEPREARKVRRYKRIDQPIWTDHKAHFIQQYLKYFVQVTKHGAYIDGFAGPQNFKHIDAWCAALVLESQPKWLRHFFLCELSRAGLKALRILVKSQPEPKDKQGRKLLRNIEILPGNFNVVVDEILRSGKIAQKEATFCLLDQRTFECHWATLQKLAAFKKTPESKIELLYFLGVGWLHRAISGIRKKDKMLKWWGHSDWPKLIKMRSFDIADLVRERFQNELGYKHVAAYPIFDRNQSNKIMYYMVHGSDHEEAPALMVRAHSKAVRARNPAIQQPFPFLQEK